MDLRILWVVEGKDPCAPEYGLYPIQEHYNRADARQAAQEVREITPGEVVRIRAYVPRESN